MAEEGFYTLFHLRDLNLIQTLLLICNKGLFELFHYHIDLVLIGIINIGKKTSKSENSNFKVKFNIKIYFFYKIKMIYNDYL